MVRLLDRKTLVSLETRSARTLYDRNSAPQRNGHAPHGSHAQQHAAGRAGAPRPHVGQERLLGAGHGPRVDRHRGQGRGDAARKGHRKIVALARKVPRIRLGMEGEVRRHDPQAAAQAGRLVRLGADLLHDGRAAHRERHQSLLRPVRKGQDLPRRTHGELGPRGENGAFGRRGGLQGVARQTLLPALQDRRHGQGDHRRHDAPRNHSGRHGAVRQPQRPALRLPAGRCARHRAAGEPFDPGDPRRIRRYRIRHGRAEGHPGARRERLHAGREIRSRNDRHLQ